MSKFSRLEAKLDALLEKSGIDLAQFDAQPTREARELTPQEQDAINNAPKVTVVPDVVRGPRVTAQNAPDVSSSVPKVPADAVGSVTVETRQPGGGVDVKTVPASKGKKGNVTPAVNWNS
jgi:hypothetical protein